MNYVTIASKARHLLAAGVAVGMLLGVMSTDAKADANVNSFGGPRGSFHAPASYGSGNIYNHNQMGLIDRLVAYLTTTQIDQVTQSIIDRGNRVDIKTALSVRKIDPASPLGLSIAREYASRGTIGGQAPSSTNLGGGMGAPAPGGGWK